MEDAIKSNGKFNWIDNILAASVFFLPLFQFASIICWAILVLLCVFNGSFKNVFKNIISYPLLVLYASLYLVYLIGMFWTEDIHAGFEDLGIKIPLLIFPLLFSVLNFSRDSFRKISIALIAGCAVAMLICLCHSFLLFLESNDFRKFYYTYFSILLHPTYFAMYLNLSLLLICQDTLSDHRKIFHSAKLRIAVFFFLMIGLILLSARLAMLSAVITLLIFIIFESFKKNKARENLFRFTIQGVLVISLGIFLIHFYNRFEQVTDVMHQNSNNNVIANATVDTSSSYYNSTTIRMGLLKNGLSVFKKNLIFGVGTGDVISESVNELNNSHLVFLSKHYTGAHNQYLQTAMSLGLFGLIILILCIIYPLKYYFQTKFYVGICFILIVVMAAMGDTILRASSLYFFTFFGSYLYVYSKKFAPE